MQYRQSEADKAVGIQCGCMLAVVALNAVVGTWSVNFLLGTFFQTTLPTFWAFVCGMIAGELTIPIAVVVKIVSMFAN